LKERGNLFVAANWTYTLKPDEHAVSENVTGTHITELCSVTAPRLLHRYANRTVYETHLSILTNIESAMLLSVSTSDYVWDMQGRSNCRYQDFNFFSAVLFSLFSVLLLWSHLSPDEVDSVCWCIYRYRMWYFHFYSNPLILISVFNLFVFYAYTIHAFILALLIVIMNSLHTSSWELKFYVVSNKSDSLLRSCITNEIIIHLLQ